MYVGKSKGRNNFQCYDESMNQNAKLGLQLEAELRRAVERQEFVLHYQPKIDLKSGQIIGAEALIRWQHPTKGLMAPGEFIGLAEQFGLICDLGDWVLKQACKQLRIWKEGGHQPVPISVNIASTQLHRHALASLIEELLSLNQIDPSLLELELTESLLMENDALTRHFLEEISAIGVALLSAKT